MSASPPSRRRSQRATRGGEVTLKDIAEYLGVNRQDGEEAGGGSGPVLDQVDGRIGRKAASRTEGKLGGKRFPRIFHDGRFARVFPLPSEKDVYRRISRFSLRGEIIGKTPTFPREGKYFPTG